MLETDFIMKTGVQNYCMERYLNRSCNSPVTHFKITDERIVVQFKDGKTYAYSYGKVGKSHVEQMKDLAKN